jgi:hypothetical protein
VRALVRDDYPHTPFEKDEEVRSHIAAMANDMIAGNNYLLAAGSDIDQRRVIEALEQFNLSQNLQIVRHRNLQPSGVPEF